MTRRPGLSRRFCINVWQLGGVALIALLGMGLALGPKLMPRVVVYSDPFEGDVYFNTHRHQLVGWELTPGGMALPPGANAYESFKFPKHPSQRILLDLEFIRPAHGTNELFIRKAQPEAQDRDTALKDQDFALEGFALDPYIEPQGLFYLTLAARSDPGPTAAPERLVTRFSLRYVTRAPSVRWGTALFFAALALVGYGALWFALLPLAVRGGRMLWRTLRQWRPVGRWMGALILAVSVLSVVVHPEWREKKHYDDLAALGNAALMVRDGYDVSELYFRSRIRPALVAWLLPFTTFLPHHLSSSTFSPSDRRERMVYFYDRDGATYGSRLYPEASLFCLLLVVAGLLVLALMGRQLGLDRSACLVMTVCAGFFFSRCQQNALSNATSFATTLLAATLALQAWRRPGWLRLLGAGVFLSFTVLLKETVIILATVLLIYFVWSWKRRRGKEQPGPWTNALVLAGLAALGPLVYYGLVLDTGFAEIAANHRLMRYHGEYHQYEPLGLVSGLKTYWAAFGWGLPLAGIGLAWAVRRRPWRDADRLFLAWTLASLWTLTAPYIFPRFLIFSIPPFAYLCARGLESLYHAALQSPLGAGRRVRDRQS